MQLLLTQDVEGIGEQHEIHEVDTDTAIDILAKRQALIATPSVRRRFAELIRRKAEERLSVSSLS